MRSPLATCRACGTETRVRDQEGTTYCLPCLTRRQQFWRWVALLNLLEALPVFRRIYGPGYGAILGDELGKATFGDGRAA